MNRFFKRLTLASLIIAIAMSILSAYIRLADSGIDCEPWPECHATSFRIDAEPGITIGADERYRGLRATHRFMASAFGILAILMVILSWWYRSEIETRLVPILVLGMTLVLAVVGIRTPDLAHPAVALTNLVGGMTLGALLTWQYAALTGPARPGLAASVIWISVLLAVASGAWVSANFANGACPGFLDCEVTLASDAFDPGRTLTLSGNQLESDEAAPLILLTHQLLGLVLTLAMMIYGVVSWKNRGSFPVIPVAATLLLLIVALAEPWFRSVPLASAHNMLALLILLVMTVEVFRGPSR